MCVYARTKNCSWLFDFNCVSNNYEYYYPADLQKQIDHGTGKGFEKCNGAHALAAERAPYSERWIYHNKSSILHFGTLGQRNNRTILSIYRRNLRPAMY